MPALKAHTPAAPLLLFHWTLPGTPHLCDFSSLQVNYNTKCCTKCQVGLPGIGGSVGAPARQTASSRGSPVAQFSLHTQVHTHTHTHEQNARQHAHGKAWSPSSPAARFSRHTQVNTCTHMPCQHAQDKNTPAALRTLYVKHALAARAGTHTHTYTHTRPCKLISV